MKENLSTNVVEHIINMISVEKKYLPGDKLPNENDLAKQLNVSRTTLRTAIAYLVSQNVLEIKRGKGTYVVEDNDKFSEYGFDKLNVEHVKLRDLYEMRLIIEPAIAELAAKNGTDKEIDNIAKIDNQLEESVKYTHENTELNKQFHNAIALASHNEFLVKVEELINEALVKAFKDEKMRQLVDEGMLNSHRSIVEFLKLRDGEGAKQAMRLHLRYSIKNYNIDL